jgi:hypothetical protein
MQDRLDNLFDLLCDLTNRLAHRPYDMIGNRNATDFRQVLIDNNIATIRGQKDEPIGAVS